MMRAIFAAGISLVLFQSSTFADGRLAGSGGGRLAQPEQRVQLPADYLELRKQFPLMMDHNRYINTVIQKYVATNAKKIDRKQLSAIMEDMRPSWRGMNMRRQTERLWEQNRGEKHARKFPWALQAAGWISAGSALGPYLATKLAQNVSVASSAFETHAATMLVLAGGAAGVWQGFRAGTAEGIPQSRKGIRKGFFHATIKSTLVCAGAVAGIGYLRTQGYIN